MYHFVLCVEPELDDFSVDPGVVLLHFIKHLISTCVTNSQCRLVNMSSFVVTGREVLLQYRRFLARIVSISDWFLHQCLNFALSSYFVLESSCNACITLSYMSWMMTRGFFS